MTTWVYVVARSADLATAAPELLKSYAIRVAVKVGLVTLALGILLTLLMMTVLTRPLLTLTRAVETVHHQENDAAALNMQLPFAERKDEIGKLSNAFQALVSRLKQEVARVTLGDAQRREMIASVSHDVRTPLTALIAQLETIRLKRNQLSGEEQGKLFDQAAGNTQHLKRLTDALAELGYLDSPEVKAVLEPMPLCELTDDIVQRFKPRAESSGLELTIDYDEKLPRVPIDAGLFDRALSNLVDNAFRYSPSGGKIAVTVRAQDNQLVRVSVSDQGPGVPESEQKRIFERFYQSSEHRSLRGSSGLGLAIVQRVVELHKGQVGVASQLGKGAQFWMDFQR
jgi:signal transduction histidine kinase